MPVKRLDDLHKKQRLKIQGAGKLPQHMKIQGGGKLRPYITLYILLCLLIFPLAGCDILPGVTVSVTPASTSSNGTQLNVWNRVATGVEVRYKIGRFLAAMMIR